MFTPFFRLILLISCAIISVVAAIFNIWTLLLFSSAFSVYLLWGYFREGAIPLALKRLVKNDYIGAEQILEQTTRPDKLRRKYRAYYAFIKGMIEREKDNFKEASAHFSIALDEGLKNEHFRAMALLAMADISMINNDREQAKLYLMRMKNLKVEPQLMPSVRKMQQLLEE